MPMGVGKGLRLFVFLVVHYLELFYFIYRVVEWLAVTFWCKLKL